MYSVSTSNHLSLFLRAKPDSPASLSQETIVIIIVSASIAALIILYALYRAIVSHISSLDAPPLPPIQPLAHHRMRRARMHTEMRSDPSYPSSYLSAPSTFPSLASSEGSKASLLDSEVGEDQKDSPLSFPSPTSMSSPQSTRQFSQQTVDGSPSRTRSVSSLGTSASRKTRRNTIYGMPHSRFSHVQIVIPAPLASSSHLSASPDSRYSHSETPLMKRARTLSFADQWVTMPATHKPDFSDILVHLPSLPKQPTT